MSSANPVVGFLVTLVALAIYGYSLNYMLFNEKLNQMHILLPEPLRKYGHLKFLTFQCLVIQFISAVLHLAAYISPRKFTKARDFVFASLAYPVGSIVVYTFWLVWHFMGRELIFPKAADEFYPNWLNHATHSIIVPINILLAIFVHHDYPKSGAFYNLLYFALYTLLLHYIKWESGYFVYGYLEVLSGNVERVAYFSFTGALAYGLYKSGQMLTGVFHPKAKSAKRSK